MLLFLLFTLSNAIYQCNTYNNIMVCSDEYPKVTYINESCYTYDDMIVCVEDVPCEFCDTRIELTDEEIEEYEKTFNTKYYR